MAESTKRSKLVAAGARNDESTASQGLDSVLDDCLAAHEALDALIMAADADIRRRDEALGTNLADMVPLNALAYLSSQLGEHLQAAEKARSAACREGRRDVGRLAGEAS